jgi:CTP synthase
MQMAVIEYSRNILGYTQANSTEMNEGTPHPVVNLMEEQKNVTDKGQCV